MRRVKLEIAKAISELKISPELEIDKLFITKINDTLITNSTKLVFTGERPGPVGVHALALALKELAPLNVNVKTLCFWRTPVRDDGLRVLCELLLPKPKNDTYKWPGFVKLELLDCQVVVSGPPNFSPSSLLTINSSPPDLLRGLPSPRPQPLRRRPPWRRRKPCGRAAAGRRRAARDAAHGPQRHRRHWRHGARRGHEGQPHPRPPQPRTKLPSIY